MQRLAGTITVRQNGNAVRCAGDFEYNLGRPKREPLMGPDKIHGYREEPQPAFIEGEIYDAGDLDLKQLVEAEGDTVTLELANGKTIALSQGVFAGDGTVGTKEGKIKVKWIGADADEV